MMQLNIMEYVLRNWKQYADSTALLLVDKVGQQEAISYRQLYHDVHGLIAGLAQLNIAPKSIICIQADEVYDLILLFLACNGLGFILYLPGCLTHFWLALQWQSI